MTERQSSAKGATSELYELALAVGTSLDPLQSARAFLAALVRLRRLDAACLWVLPERPGAAGGEVGFELLTAAPEGVGVPLRIGAAHPAVTRFGASPVVLRRADAGFAEWQPVPDPPGAVWVFWALGNYGLLGLAGPATSAPAAAERAALEPIVDRFAVTLAGLLAAQRLNAEAGERRLVQDSLAREQALSRSLIDAIPDLIFYQDLDGAYLGCNKAFEALVGRPEEALVGRVDEGLLERLGIAASGGLAQTRRSQNWVRFADGREVLLETLLTPFHGPGGQLLGLLGISRDETEQHEANAARRESEERYRAIVEQAVDAVVLYRIDDGRFVEFNEPAHRGLGYSREAFARLTVEDIQVDAPDSARRPTEPGQADVYETRCRAFDGGMRDMLVAAKRIELRDGAYVAAVWHDITVVKRSLKQLDHLAHHDPLTDLPNRLLFLSRLDQAIDRIKHEGRHLAVLFLDLDRFKNINDSLGHPVGDQVLQAVAERLRGRVGGKDTLARLGGDEFTVLLERVEQPRDAARTALELIECLRAPVRLPGDHELYVDVGIGIATYPGDGVNATELVRNADAAMYRAKAVGPGSYCFYTEDMTHEIAERLVMETRLRQAFERGELRVDYQPILALEEGRLVAVEALVHWTDARFGRVSPERFIPLAEETGLIEQIGDWVLREGCAQVRRWDEAGLPPLSLAVNLSVRQLERADFAARVRGVLRETGLPAARLEFELTETSLMQRQSTGKATLNELKSMGIGLAVDDFGTGYSSLAYLKQLAVDKLKIDKSFVSDIPQDTSDLQIVSAIVVMARNLKLRLVAEGVETVEQEEILKGLGCDYVQGFRYAQPLSPAGLERFARPYGPDVAVLPVGDAAKRA